MPDKKCFFSSTKKGKIGDDCKKLDSDITHREYLTCAKIWDIFDMKNMGDLHDHYLKKDGIS